MIGIYYQRGNIGEGINQELAFSIHTLLYIREITGNSLGFQWLGLHTSTAEGVGLIPGQRTKSHIVIT